MEIPLTPAVYWTTDGKDGDYLKAEGPVPERPLATLGLALAAVAEARESDHDHVHVVFRGVDGWWVFGFSENRTGRVDLDEIAVRDLPLGADPFAPLTYVIDAAGVTGVVVNENGTCRLRPAVLTPRGEVVPSLGGGPFFTIVSPFRSQILEPPVSVAPVEGFAVPRAMENVSKIVAWTPALAFRPGLSLKTLSSGLRWMSQHLPAHWKIRAVGSRHSWSPVARCEDVTILPGGWSGIVKFKPGELINNPPVDGTPVRVLAGTRIREINQALAARGLAIPVLGGFDGQTIGGVLPTGTHGSVLGHGPLADLICSIDLVKFDGGVLRIEPARAPVTNPAALAGMDPPVELVVDDTTFDAVRIGVGAMGVIHSLVLRTVPKFWLREVRTAMPWNPIKNALRGGNIYKCFLTAAEAAAAWRNPATAEPPGGPAPSAAFPGHPTRSLHFELLWNPYTDHTLITTRHFVGAGEFDKLTKKEPRFFADPPVRNLFRLFGFDPMSDAYSRTDLPELAAEHLGGAAIRILEEIAKDRPEKVPALIDSSISGLVDRNGYIQRSYNVYNIGRAANLLPALSATISVPLRNDMWLQAVDILREIAVGMLKKGIVQTAPTALRFVAKSPALLADPEDCCKFEIIFGGRDATVATYANAIVKEQFRALTAALGANVRLHFGQLIPEGTLDAAPPGGGQWMQQLYPRFGEWCGVRQQLDPGGRGRTKWDQGVF